MDLTKKVLEKCGSKKNNISINKSYSKNIVNENNSLLEKSFENIV